MLACPKDSRWNNNAIDDNGGAEAKDDDAEDENDGRDGFALLTQGWNNPIEEEDLRGMTITTRIAMIVTTLHLSKLALLTQRGTIPDVEAALERHCRQLVYLVMMPFHFYFLRVFW